MRRVTTTTVVLSSLYYSYGRGGSTIGPKHFLLTGGSSTWELTNNFAIPFVFYNLTSVCIPSPWDFLSGWAYIFFSKKVGFWVTYRARHVGSLRKLKSLLYCGTTLYDIYRQESFHAKAVCPQSRLVTITFVHLKVTMHGIIR